MIGTPEILLILLLVLLFFGGRKLPEVARGLGRGLREFKKARDGICESIESADVEATASTAKPEPEVAPEQRTEPAPGDKPQSAS